MSRIDKQIYFWAHMLDECYDKHLVTEGKHWPEDYMKTAVNAVKASKLGQALDDTQVKDDIAEILRAFTPLSHKSSNLGFFMAVVRWFIEYAGSSKQKHDEFFGTSNDKGVLDKVISSLLMMRNDREYDSQSDAVKKMSFKQFMQLADEIDSKTADISASPIYAEYEVVPIRSYEQLNTAYGGAVTGYNGKSEWCHTNGEHTYDRWINDNANMFFIVQRDDWKDIATPNDVPETPYDEYGMSLIAVLVDVRTNALLHSTSRWNHVVLPKSGDADQMFSSWQELNKAVDTDIESICRAQTEEFRKTAEARSREADRLAAQAMARTEIIDEHTFDKSYKSFITAVHVPDNVTSIERSAFLGCHALTSVTMSDSVKTIDRAFHDCSRLANVAISNGVIRIGDNAFLNCYRLSSVMFGSDVQTIGYGAFDGCKSLTSMSIPDSVTRIEPRAFAHCTRLVDLSIGNNVKYIGTYAFLKCQSLTHIVLPDNAVDLGTDIFDGCTSLEDAVLPRRIATIPYGMFTNCTSLTSIEIPDNVTCIGGQAFYNCTNLKNIAIPQKVNYIDHGAFQYSGLEHIEIPSNVECIMAYTFNQCRDLTSVMISAGVTSIEYAAFEDCDRLASVTVPRSVESIGQRVFKNCSSLTSLMFEDRTLEEVRAMANYPWGIRKRSAIKAGKHSETANAAKQDRRFKRHKLGT